MKKQKILVLRGLPASGKTTWAKQFILTNPDYIRVNRDDIRAMIVPEFKFGSSMEVLVGNIEDSMIKESLLEGYNIIVDATNFRGTTRFQRIIDGIGRYIDCNLEVSDEFLKVPVEECIRRDLTRDKPVGAKVIQGMYDRYLGEPKKVPVTKLTTKIGISNYLKRLFE